MPLIQQLLCIQVETYFVSLLLGTYVRPGTDFFGSVDLHSTRPIGYHWPLAANGWSKDENLHPVSRKASCQAESTSDSLNRNVWITRDQFPLMFLVFVTMLRCICMSRQEFFAMFRDASASCSQEMYNRDIVFRRFQSIQWQRKFDTLSR